MRARWFALLPVVTASALAQPLPEPAPEEPVPGAGSLTAHFEEQLATQEWTLVKGGPAPLWQPVPGTPAYPLRLYLADADTGARAVMQPAAYFTTADRHRWGGRTLGVDWVLVLDGLSNDQLRISTQFKSTTPRVLTAEIGLDLGLTGWTWHDGPRHPIALGPGVERLDNAEPGVFGRTGRRARYPISVISQPGQALVLEAGLPEPACFHSLADHAAGWWGLQLDFALDPRTVQFPGRAAFVVAMRATTNGGTGAFRAAWQEFLPRAHQARTWDDNHPLRFDDDSFAHAQNPPVYRKDERRAGLAKAVPFDLGQAGRLDVPADQQTRLDEAGWLPLSPWRAEGVGVIVDEFGSPTAALRQVVISSTSAWPQVVQVELPGHPEPILLADPDSGALEVLPPGTTGTRIWLEPGRPVRREWFGWPALDEVRNHYRGKEPGTPGIQALTANLDSLARLRALEADLTVRVAEPVEAGRDHPIQLALANRGTTGLTLLEAGLHSEATVQPLLNQPVMLEPDQTAELTGFLNPASVQPPASWLNLQLAIDRQGTGVDVGWRRRWPVVNAVWAHVPTGRVVTVEGSVTLPVQVWNRTESAQDILLSNRGDFGGPEIRTTLAPGEPRVIAYTLDGTDPRPGVVRLHLEAGPKFTWEQTVAVEFLAPEASLARDLRVRVETSPAAPDADGLALRDGDYATGWSSDPATEVAWIGLDFPEPTAVSEVTLVWPEHSVSQAGHVRGRTAAGEEVELASFANTNRVATLRLEFAEVQLGRIEVRQGPGEGSPDQPNLLRLNELEVR